MNKIENLEVLEKIKKLQKIGETVYYSIANEYPVVFNDNDTYYNTETGFSKIDVRVSFAKIKTIKFDIWHGYFGSGFCLSIKDRGSNPKKNSFVPILRSFDSTSIFGFEELLNFKLENLTLGKVKKTKLVNAFDCF